MIADVMQTLTVCIEPVNRPSVGDGWYRAFVTADNDPRIIEGARNMALRGLRPRGVGYAESVRANIAAENAIWDYTNQFGPLCVTGASRCRHHVLTAVPSDDDLAVFAVYR